ncbi:MAG: HAD family phosphatase [Candidatus Altiarchaeota archaeon]|nr:HAD family phosphatase [Candidatus Altiarchaeota archaeon]
MINAVIFDMDGVISDTQKVHAGTESKLLQDLGVTVSPDEITKRFAGVPDSETFRVLLEENGKSADIQSLLTQKMEIFEATLRSGVDEILGSVNLITWLHEKRVPLAVATSLKRSLMEIVLDELHIREFFTATVPGDEVSKGKPDPEIFLKAAKLLGVKPEDCIVIEDGKSGLKGAKKAGMKTIGLGDHVSGLGDFSAKTPLEIKAHLNSLI